MTVIYKKVMKSLIGGYLGIGCKFYAFPDICGKYPTECQCPWSEEDQQTKRCFVPRN